MKVLTTGLCCLIILQRALTASAQVRPEKQIGCWYGYDGSINFYADTLNLIQKPSQLPKFLDDYLIDWKLRDNLKRCLKDPSEKISFRFVVLERVYREDVLEWIVESKDVHYDKLYVPEELKKAPNLTEYNDFPSLPFMKYSWRQLAKMRLEEMRKQKKALNK